MKVLISKKEFNALMDIRGLPDTVYSMLYAFKEENGKHVLEGDEESFDDLLSLISEEIEVEFCPKKNISALLGVCKKVDPESLEWIGM
jgi:hypothetical protein